MRTRSFAASLGLWAAMAGVPAMADITVQFVEPERYIDAGNHGHDREHNLRTVERHLKSVSQCLGADESLELRVLDVDLAGRREWGSVGSSNLRVMREITWPRLNVQYRWRDPSGQVIGEGQEWLADPSYLWRSAYVRNDPDELPYEKAMLREWFEKRFCAGRS